jgi:hypothetical protein
MTRRRARRLGGAAVALALTCALGACGDGDGTASAVEGISIERTTTTEVPAVLPSTTVAVELLPSAQLSRPKPPDPRSWEGQKYDFGIVDGVEPRDGGWVVIFDREEITDQFGSRSGPTLTEEPVLIGDTDQRIENSSSQLRVFGLLPTATVLRLSASWTCAQPMPVWDHLDVEQLERAGTGADTRAALTFDADGQVTQIRLTRGC